MQLCKPRKYAHNNAMSYTVQEVKQRALYKLGEREYIANAATESPIDTMFSGVLREANHAGHWSWARAKASVSQGTSTHAHEYALPGDFLRLISVKDADDRLRYREPWELIGKSIVTTSASDSPASLTVRYTRDIQLTSSGSAVTSISLPDDPDFIEYLVALLAARCAPAIVGAAPGMQLESSLNQLAEQLQMKALTRDKQQDSSNDHDPDRDIWVHRFMGGMNTRR